jgi:hypothetical protein
MLRLSWAEAFIQLCPTMTRSILLICDLMVIVTDSWSQIIVWCTKCVHESLQETLTYCLSKLTFTLYKFARTICGHIPIVTKSPFHSVQA